MSDLEQTSVRSPDGTNIAFVRMGNGPSLVLVHGSLATGERWMQVASILASQLTCFVMDRRGHGHSGDSTHYSIEREYEDIESLLGEAGSEASLLGHSYGAVCALGTATRTRLRRLILYEPPLPVNGSVAGGALPDYKKAIDARNFDLALEIGLTKFAGVTSNQVQALRKLPAWPKMVALAPTWTREIEAMDALGPSLTRYGQLTTPTLLLTGTLSPKHPLKDSVLALSATLKNCTVASLDGQGHEAHSLAPALIAEKVASFVLNR